MIDKAGSHTDQGRRPRLLRLAALALVLAGLAAIIATVFWPAPPLDPRRPATWPVSEERAVVIAAGLGRRCPHNKIWWVAPGRAWREAGTWQQAAEGEVDMGEGELVTLAKAGTLCLRAGRDLGSLQKLGTGAEEASGAALYLAVTPRDGDCPPGTNYATPGYCLTATPLPPAPDIAP